MSETNINIIKVFGEWPEPVQHLVQFLHRPLPSWVTTGPYPFTSTRSSKSIPELSKYTTSSSYTLSEDDSPLTRSIEDVFDIVMFTTSLLKFRADDTTTQLLVLIRALCRTCIDDVCLLAEVPFVLPHTVRKEMFGEEPTEGHATALFSFIAGNGYSKDTCPGQCRTDSESYSHYAMKSDSQELKKRRDPMEIDETSEAQAGEKVDDDDDDTEQEEDGDVESINSEASLTPSINLPLNAHIIPGRGRRFSVVIPLLCVADQNNIFSLISSALYQRRVLGIDETIIGLLFSKYEAKVQVVLGWLSKEPAGLKDLPTVYMACAESTSLELAESPESLGIFDLADPLSSLKFAQFILGLELYFHRICNGSPQQGSQDFLEWRSDLPFKESDILSDGWRERIKKWVLDVERSNSPSHNLVPFSNVGSMNTKKSTEAHSKMSPLSSPQSPDENEDNNSAKTGICKSSSSLAQKSDVGLSEGWTITNWLAERNVVTISRVKLDAQSKKAVQETSEINGVIQLYDELTSFSVPENWSELGFMPQVDAGVLNLREKLFREIQAATSKSDSVHFLSKSVAHMLADRLSLILWHANGLDERDSQFEVRGIYEVEWRHNWDALLYGFLGADEASSCDTLPERTLNFSRNPAFDERNTPQFWESQVEKANTYAKHCHAAVDALDGSHFALTRQCAAAVIHATNLQEQGRTRISTTKHATDATKALERCSYKEATTGTCDAICVWSCSGFVEKVKQCIPDEKDSVDFLRNFPLVCHPSPEDAPKLGPKAGDHSGAADNDSSTLDSRMLSPPSTEPSMKTNNETKRAVQNIFSVTSSQPPEVPRQINTSQSQCKHYNDDLLLPVYTMEHKRLNDSSIGKSVNQSRFYSASSVEFLKVVGITDHPVLNLVTQGQVGIVTMSWYSSKYKRTYLMERNPISFDISDLIGTLHFVIFLLKFAEYSNCMKEKFDSIKDDFYAKVASDYKALLKWTKSAQKDEDIAAGHIVEGKSKKKENQPSVSPIL